MLAKWVGDYFSHSIYERLIEMKGIPFLENNPPKALATLTVTEVMQRNVDTFKEIEKVSTVVQVLTETTHYGFPVVSETGYFVGNILRNQLLVLLQKKLFTSDPSKPPSI